MTDLTTTHLKHLLEQATPGPWTVEDDGYDIIVGNAEGHRMGWGDQVRFKFEAGDKKHDTALAALAPELAEEVIRLREELQELRDQLKKKSECYSKVELSTDPLDGIQLEDNYAEDEISRILGDHDE
ncbi:hypothetical protein RAE07_11620 [Corynebacterium kefirresidentii]|uniref:hypothetical protein n=1 Tax=Corynebacterium sp. CTNIH14 TaxID=3230065 RepID=UPI002934C13B|nr:hypothetical protein [Corynebacterium kefirresidentii]MDV2415954.1 hypothetical protein [Corynebacterium kefirresidentii]